MKFDEYIKTECRGVMGKRYWDKWTEINYFPKEVIKLPPSIYPNLAACNSWNTDNCQGRVLMTSRFALFEFEEDSVLFTLRWF